MKKILNFTTMTALLVVMMFPSLVQADLDVNITDNGANSQTDVKVKTETKQELEQENKADVDNKVNLSANTGGNAANSNTNGKVNLKTGKVDAMVVFSNTVNLNSAIVTSCCKLLGDKSIKVADNGAKSKQDVKVETESKLDLEQENDADVENEVDADLSTGDNTANKNTNGDVDVKSGKVFMEVGVENIVNANEAEVESCGCDQPGDVVVKLKNNGTKTETKVDVEVSQGDEFNQENDLELENEVKAKDVSSGNNQAGKTTNGKVELKTGKVHFLVSVFNQLNINLLKVK